MSSTNQQPDRYISFEGIDCYQNAYNVLERVLHLVQDSNKSNKFWKMFVKKIPEAYYNKTHSEELIYLVCSHIYYIEELFETSHDTVGLELLTKAEFECC
ncbi:MAG: N(2)-fixation sustaining protein CowN [Phormidium sp.]